MIDKEKEKEQILKNLNNAKNSCFTIIQDHYDLRYYELVNKIIPCIDFVENKIKDEKPNQF